MVRISYSYTPPWIEKLAALLIIASFLLLFQG